MRKDQLFSLPVLIFMILNYLCMLALFSFLSNLGIGKGFLLSFPFLIAVLNYIFLYIRYHKEKDI
ncbi:hypothetical protein [Staphylococcus chromogenes]|uniref:hypothetical protein n=1 Tax=Staphylococcus chromogenes TaxID=46126 RepID=UPI00290525A6|nr:hypothetical protein [Staphylococcus chromogenes]MDU0451245.1 hypothetical protein [Staphylococcus chromogenes]